MLGLKVDTDEAWVEAALRDLDGVLVDHAHCEMKAASNALSLVARHPESAALVRALTELAREEIEHFQRMLALLEARSLSLGSPPVDDYAASLRSAAQADSRGPKLGPLVDRLLVGALIEARSCERFKLLADATRAAQGRQAEHALWSELLAAEARHYRTFVDLAARAAGGDRARVEARLDALSAAEAKIVADLAHGAASRATIHG